MGDAGREPSDRDRHDDPAKPGGRIWLVKWLLIAAIAAIVVAALLIFDGGRV
ncbi:MAG: hypothetical protein KDK91_11390 [Gammaproteobacteria bacterium]|nr:hypothetical protein [Gammaproteobacteria bacterium]